MQLGTEDYFFPAETPALPLLPVTLGAKSPFTEYSTVPVSLSGTIVHVVVCVGVFFIFL